LIVKNSIDFSILFKFYNGIIVYKKKGDTMNTNLSIHLEHAQKLFNELNTIRTNCLYSLQAMVNELCEVHNLEFSTGMGSWDFKCVIETSNKKSIEFFINNHGITRRVNKRLKDTLFNNESELERHINDDLQDLNGVKDDNDSDSIEFFEEDLLVLNKTKEFYQDFLLLQEEVKKIELVFSLENILETMKDYKKDSK